MKEENEPDHKKLKDFLLQKPEESLDDFEREALEGFAMLESGTEILNLKAETDRKVYEKLQGRPARKTVYWFAAAGLVLCIGLAVFFVSQNITVHEQNLAIEQKVYGPGEAQADSPVPESKPEGLEKAASPSNESSVDKGSGSSTKKVEKDGLLSDDSKPTGTLDETKKEEPQRLREDLSASGLSAPEPPSAYQPAAPSTLKNTNATDQGAEAMSQETVPRNDEFSEADESNVKAVKAKSQSPERKKDMETVLAASPAAGQTEISASCSYPGGDAELRKELTKQLNAKSINKAFAVRLFISKKGKVERVEFIDASSFSKEEKQKLEQVLKQLSKFENPNATSATYLIDYKL